MSQDISYSEVQQWSHTRTSPGYIENFQWIKSFSLEKHGILQRRGKWNNKTGYQEDDEEGKMPSGFKGI